MIAVASLCMCFTQLRTFACVLRGATPVWNSNSSSLIFTSAVSFRYVYMESLGFRAEQKNIKLKRIGYGFGMFLDNVWRCSHMIYVRAVNFWEFVGMGSLLIYFVTKNSNPSCTCKTVLKRHKQCSMGRMM